MKKKTIRDIIMLAVMRPGHFSIDQAEEEIKGLFEEIDMVIRNNHYRWFDETCQRGLIKALKDWWHTK